MSSTDGVGTKTAIAAAMGRLDTIGIDLVAMCADDVVCTGAEPLAFLDYVAVGRLVPERVAALVAGIAEGCRQAGAALIGGETAEHPGLMADDDFDLAGFCIGIVERSRILDGTAARRRRRDRRARVVGAAQQRVLARPRDRSPSTASPLDLPYAEALARGLGDAAAADLLAAGARRATARPWARCS